MPRKETVTQVIDGGTFETIRRNADPIWLHQNEMWELMESVLEDESAREAC